MRNLGLRYTVGFAGDEKPPIGAGQGRSPRGLQRLHNGKQARSEGTRARGQRLSAN